MAKRGLLMAVALVGAIILLLVLTVPLLAEKIASRKLELKAAASRDIALLLDTIYACPYDIELEYDFDLTGFTVEVSDNKVKIYDASYSAPENDPFLAQYSFVPVNGNPDFTLGNPKKLFFRKTGGILTLKDENI